MTNHQSEADKDREVASALEAYEASLLIRATDDEMDPEQLWEILWKTCDFSWEGLSDAGWSRLDDANFSQKLKRWRAPIDFPGSGAVHHVADKSWKEASLQDYWRWSRSRDGTIDANALASDAELQSAGLLREFEGKSYHVAHWPGNSVSQHEGGEELNTPESDASDAYESLKLLLASRFRMAEAYVEGGHDLSVQLRGTYSLDLLAHAHDLQEFLKSPFTLDARLSRLTRFKGDGFRFDDYTDFSRSLISDATSFDQTSFSDHCRFDRCIIQNGIKFHYSSFGSSCNFAGSKIAGNVSFRRCEFGNRTTFSNAIFADDVSFSSCVFGAETSFSGVRLGLRADFSNTKFGSLATFLDFEAGANSNFSAADFGSGTYFGKSAFGAQIRFNYSVFGDNVRFYESQFGTELSFFQATFRNRCSFSDVTIADDVSFSRASFGTECEFSRCQFGERAVFANIAAGDQTRFERTVFGDHCNFMGAVFGVNSEFADLEIGSDSLFSGSSFGSGTKFSDSSIGDRARFYAFRTEENVTFSDVALGDAAVFSNARFGDGIVFRNFLLGSGSSFSNVHFGNADLHIDLRSEQSGKNDAANMRFMFPVDFTASRFDSAVRFTGPAPTPYPGFRRCNFVDRADFSGIEWDERSFYGNMFEGARFLDVVDMRCTNFSAFEIFNQATFKETLLLGAAVSEAEQKLFFQRASRAANNEISFLRKHDREGGSSSITETKRQVWAQLSGGYRVLKTAMKASGDFDREQTYYRYEVKSRLKAPEIGVTERMASAFYNLFSDYGASIGRPFVGLVFFTLLFASFYYLISNIALDQRNLFDFGSLRFDGPRALQCLELAISNASGPLSGMTPQGNYSNSGNATFEMPLGSRLLQETTRPWAILVRLASFVQSLISIILAFLVGLAVRRKFQIA